LLYHPSKSLTDALQITKAYKVITDNGTNLKDYETIQTQIENNISDHFDIKPSNNNTNKIKEPTLLKEMMKTEYNYASQKQFSYFVLNHSNRIHPITGEVLTNSFDKYNSWIYKKNIYTKDETNFSIKEKKEGEFLDSKFKNWSHSKIARVKYLDYHNKDKIKLFITITLPSSYHPYKNYGKPNQRKNDRYQFDNIEDAINEGFGMLKKIHRHFYSLVKKKMERKNINLNFDYLSVIEAHKSLIPHLHSLYYIDKEQEDIFYEAYQITIKKFDIKRQEIEKLKSATGSSYLYKYLTKMDGVFKYYKKYFSHHRIFKISNLKHVSQQEMNLVYKYLFKYKPKLLTKFKNMKKPLYVTLEEFIVKRIRFQYQEVSNAKLDIQYLQELIKEQIENYINSIKDEYWIDQEEQINHMFESVSKKLYFDHNTLLESYIEHKSKRIDSIYLVGKNKSECIYKRDMDNFISQGITKKMLYEYYIDLYCDKEE
jgi:hypothetical protein